MKEFGLWFALYIASTFFFYVLWRLFNKPIWIEKIRNYGNLLACLLPFLMYFALSVDYIPHDIGYVAYMRGFMRISDSFCKIKAFYLFLPFVLFIFSMPKFRKSWKISLIISLIAIPVIDFHAFSVWLYNIPDDFYHANSKFNEALHMAVFAQRFSLCLGVFIAFLILILILEKSVKKEEN
jgi:hypothetical protein